MEKFDFGVHLKPNLYLLANFSGILKVQLFGG